MRPLGIDFHRKPRPSVLGWTLLAYALAALAVLFATIAMVLWIGSRIYSNSVLHTGGRVAWKDALAKTE